MAFTKNTIDLLGIPLILMLLTLPSIAANIDCNGKSFHCVNSTHFMICVDLGSGVSITIDDFVIPCPPPTVCQRTNRFECDFPEETVAPFVATTVTSVSGPIDIVTSPYEPVTSVPIEKHLDTSTEPTLSKDVLITHQTTAIVTESTIQLVTDASQNNELIITRNEITPSTEIQSNFTITTLLPNNIVAANETTSVASENFEKNILETKLNAAVTENILSSDSLVLPNNISVSSFNESLGRTETVNLITHESITNSTLNETVPSETEVMHTRITGLPFETTGISDIQTNVTFITLNTQNLNDTKSGYDISSTFDETNPSVFVTENILSTEAFTLQNNTKISVLDVSLVTNESSNNSMLNKTFKHANDNLGLPYANTEVTPSLGDNQTDITFNNQLLSIPKAVNHTNSTKNNTEIVNLFKPEFEINSTFSETHAFETENNSSKDTFAMINDTSTSTLDVPIYATDNVLNKTYLSTTETTHVSSSFDLPNETTETFLSIDNQTAVTKPNHQPLSINNGANTTTIITNSTKNGNVTNSRPKINSISNKTDPNTFLNNNSIDVFNNGKNMKDSMINSTISTHESQNLSNGSQIVELKAEIKPINETGPNPSIPNYSTIIVPTNSYVNATEIVNIITNATENNSTFDETTPNVNDVQYVSSTSNLNLISDYATDSDAQNQTTLLLTRFSNDIGVYNVTESTLTPRTKTYNTDYLNNTFLPNQINYTTTKTITNNVTDMLNTDVQTEIPKKVKTTDKSGTNSTLTGTSSNSQNTASNTISISSFNTVMPSPTTETITELLTNVTEMNPKDKVNKISLSDDVVHSFITTPLSKELTTADTFSTQDTKTPEISIDYFLITSTPSADVGRNESTLPSVPSNNNYKVPTTPMDTKQEEKPATQIINHAASNNTMQNKTNKATLPKKLDIDQKLKLTEYVQNVSEAAIQKNEQTKDNVSETTHNHNIIPTDTIKNNLTTLDPKANVTLNVTVPTVEGIEQNYSVSLKNFTLQKNNTITFNNVMIGEVSRPSILDDVVQTSYPSNSTSSDYLVNTVTELPILNVTENEIIKVTHNTLINSSLKNSSNSSLVYIQHQSAFQNTTASMIPKLNSNFSINDVHSAAELEVTTNLPKENGAVTSDNVNITSTISFKTTKHDLGNIDVETHTTKTIDVPFTNSYITQSPNYYVGSSSKLFIETSTEHTNNSEYVQSNTLERVKGKPVNISHTTQRTLNVLSVDDNDLANITGFIIKQDTTSRNSKVVNRALDTKNTDFYTKQNETSNTTVSGHSKSTIQTELPKLKAVVDVDKQTQTTELIAHDVIINTTVSSAIDPTELYYTSTNGKAKSDTNKSIFAGSANVETMILSNTTTTLIASTVQLINEQENSTATIQETSRTKTTPDANLDKAHSNIISTSKVLSITADYPSDQMYYESETTPDTIIHNQTEPNILEQKNVTATVQQVFHTKTTIDGNINKAPINTISTSKVLGTNHYADLVKDALNTSTTSMDFIQENKDMASSKQVLEIPSKNEQVIVGEASNLMKDKQSQEPQNQNVQTEKPNATPPKILHTPVYTVNSTPPTVLQTKYIVEYKPVVSTQSLNDLDVQTTGVPIIVDTQSQVNIKPNPKSPQYTNTKTEEIVHIEQGKAIETIMTNPSRTPLAVTESQINPTLLGLKDLSTFKPTSEAWREHVVTKPFIEVSTPNLTKREQTEPRINLPTNTDAFILSNKQNETELQVTVTSEIEKPLTSAKSSNDITFKESWSTDMRNSVGIKQGANTQSTKHVPISVTEFINTYPVTQRTKQLITNTFASNTDVDIVVIDATKISVPLSTKNTYSAISGKQTRPQEIESFEQPEGNEEEERSEYEESKREKEEEHLEALGELNNVTPKTRKITSTQNKTKYDTTVEMTTSKVEELSNSHYKSLDNIDIQHKIVKFTENFQKGHVANTKNHNTTSFRENIKNNTVSYSLTKSKLNVSVTESTKSGFVCKLNSRGKFSDQHDCSKFYICMGKQEPVEGLCPNNTVFSELKKQCTKNLSHCVRNNQFQCVLEGRFSDYFIDNIYYICVKNNVDSFTRFKLQCQSGYVLNKTSVRCALNTKSIRATSPQSISDFSINSEQSVSSARSQKLVVESSNKFECKDVGKFPDPNNCRRYFICTKKNGKSRYRLKKKKCDSDELFHKDKKKCVDAESYDCS